MEDLAEQLGISARNYYQWEEGTTQINAIERIVKIADYLQCPLDELFGRTPRTPDHSAIAQEVVEMMLPQLKGAIRTEINRTLGDQRSRQRAEDIHPSDIARGVERTDVHDEPTVPPTTPPEPPEPPSDKKHPRSSGDR